MLVFNSIFLSVLLAGQSWAKLDWSLLGSAVNGGPSLKAVAADAPASNITEMDAQFFTDLGSKRVKVKYGPYMAPGSGEDDGMKTFLERQAEKPCDECLITYMQASLEYPNGTNANANSGMWLHHTVLLDTAVQDAVCPMGIAGLKVAPNRFFASGNERTPVNFCTNGTSKTGYFLSNDSNLFALLELMNETPEPREAVMTVEYEFIPAPIPADFQRMRSIWLDVDDCGDSEVDVPDNRPNTTFMLDMQPGWTVPQDWKENLIIGSGAHLHDGGMNLQITKNNESVCDCVASYGATPDYIDMMAGMDMSGMDMGGDMVHISNISYCKDATTIEAGDQLSLRAYYNMTAHPGMVENDGNMSPVMGIAVLYAAQSNDSNPTPSAIGMGGSTATATVNPEMQMPASTGMSGSGSGTINRDSSASTHGMGSSATVLVMVAAGFVAFFMI